MIVEENTMLELNGVQIVHLFPNGYGASVVKHDMSYGGKQGLWEMAVLKNGELCYNTSVTSDVLGHLSDEDVEFHLKEIENL
jgi:hypothetical protein